jgi:hypothetical protein
MQKRRYKKRVVPSFGKVIEVRYFKVKYMMIKKIVAHSKIVNEDGSTLKKYDSMSHFIRCGIERLIREEVALLEINKQKVRLCHAK